MQDTPSRRKSRSPKAPGIALGVAIKEVGKIYGAYGHAAFSRAEMASALGMSADSGAFLNKVGAIRDYGLLVGRGSDLLVSDLFKAIYAASQSGDGDIPEQALVAIRSSGVFAGLLQEFPNRIPDVSAIALRLENKERFNRDRARVVAEAFRGSLVEFGLIDGSGNLVGVGPKAETAENGSPETGRLPIAAAPETDAPTTGSFRVEIPLGPGRKASLILPDDLDERDVTRVTAVLRGYVS